MPSTSAITPTQDEEQRLRSDGYLRIAGLDEVGRGPLAGPVVAAAVVLPDLRNEHDRELRLVRDSKALSPCQRERAAILVRRLAIGIGIGMAGPNDIDRLGIVSATRLAMYRAAEGLPERPDHLLVDALRLAWENVPCTPIVHGDQQCTAIAAASVVAKVHRDALMVEFDASYPGYGFAAHKGYGTKRHLAALLRSGPTPIHRRSFAPLRQGDHA